MSEELDEVIKSNEDNESVYQDGKKPWRPSNVRDIPSQFFNPSFRYRFSLMDNDNIDKRLMEGWVIDREVGYKMKEHGIAFRVANVDGSPLDGTVQIRGQILMRMHKSVAEKRAKFYEDRSTGAMESASSELKKAEHAGERLAYGKIDVSHS